MFDLICFIGKCCHSKLIFDLGDKRLKDVVNFLLSALLFHLEKLHGLVIEIEVIYKRHEFFIVHVDGHFVDGLHGFLIEKACRVLKFLKAFLKINFELNQ
jgi:hypothetical protein